MIITLDLPDDLALQLNSLEDELPQILALGLQKFQFTPQTEFEGIAEVIEFLATLPSPEAKMPEIPK